MNIDTELKRHRVKHIISSYHLAGEPSSSFDNYLETLLECYPAPLIELALVETLVESWLKVPLPRGCSFLAQADEKLKAWQGSAIASTLSPEQFQQITGLDPSPIFGSSGTPPAQPPMRTTGSGF